MAKLITLDNLSRFKDNIDNQPARVFAENERQKSKNLFNLYDFDSNLSEHFSFAIDNNQITFTSTNTVAYFAYMIPVETGKTYTISAESVAYNGESLYGLLIGSTYNRDISDYGYLLPDNLSLTFTATNDTLYIKGYVTYNTIGDTFVINKLQVEEGVQATEYQAYNGKIAHEKDVTNCDILYDAKSTDTKLTWGQTGGLGQYTKSIHLSKYKYLRFYYFTAGYTTGCTVGFVDLQSIKTTQDGETKYFGDTAGSLFKATDAAVPFLTFGRISVNKEKTTLTTDCINRWYNGYADDGGSGRIVKIEGVY